MMGTTIDRRSKNAKGGTQVKHKNASCMLKEYFEANGVIFYQRNAGAMEIFLLPYNIRKQNIRFNIQIVVYERNNYSLCRMSFSHELNEDKDYSKDLLNMNAELIKGRLSVEPDSNQVTYTTTFRLDSNSDVELLYKRHFEICVSVLASLYTKNIIKTNE